MGERNSIGLIFNAGMVLTLLAGGFLLVQPPIKSQRPQGNTGIEQDQGHMKRLSRLWQDPFESARVMQKERESESVRPVAQTTTLEAGNVKLSFKVEGFSTPQKDHSSFNKYGDAYYELLWNGLLGSESEDWFKNDSILAAICPCLERLRNRYGPIDLNKKSVEDALNSFRIFAVMVPGKPYQDQAERRIRYRVALAHGMSEAGYIPTDADHIGCFLFHTRPQNSKGNFQWNKLRGLWQTEVASEIPVPYELYKKDENKDDEKKESVLVLWIDEDAFSPAPLMLLNLLRRQIAEARKKISGTANDMAFQIIGPYSSTTLERIQKEAKIYDGNPRLKKSCGSKLVFYNYSATNQKNDSALSETGGELLRIHHLISSDEMLMQAIHRELELRNWSWGTRDVILLSEHDTTYGRELPEAFVNIAKSEYKGGYEFYRYGYLRGIDGTTAAEASAKEDKRLSGASPSQSEKDLVKLLNRWSQGKHTNPPLGNNQLDYIARLTMDINNKHSRPFAIGILGSDTYDKLMLLQSLRSMFPDALFFTTDLDAQYLDVDSVRTAHGLLIASSYGFSLHPNIQKKTPPFRGNYQTALFHAILTAVDDKNPDSANDRFLKQQSLPRIFEIGWYNPVDLTMESPTEYKPLTEDQPDRYKYLESWADVYEQNKVIFFNGNDQPQASLHPFSPRLTKSRLDILLENGWWIILFVFLASGISLATGQFKLAKELFFRTWTDKIHPPELYPHGRLLREQLGWIPVVLMLIIVIPAIGVIAYCDSSVINGGEPFSLWEGTSSWPLFLVHCTAFYLGLTFLLIAARNSQKISVDVSKNVFPNEVGSWPTKNKRKILLDIRKYPLLRSFGKSISHGLNAWKNKEEKKESRKTKKEYIEECFKTDGDKKQSLWNAWKEYCVGSNDRFLKMLWYFSIAFIFAGIFLGFMLYQSHWADFRGDGIGVGFFFVVCGIVGAYMMLNFLACIVVADSLFSKQFISKISPHQLLPRKENEVRTFSIDNSEHYRVVKMIGEWTHITKNLVWLPTILLFILTVARISVIENFGRGETIRLCYGLIIALLIFVPVYKLYVEARKLRKNLIADLKNQLVELQSANGDKRQGVQSKLIIISPEEPVMTVKPEQVQTVIEEIEKYQKGIYSPWLWHPMASAFLVLSGGISFPLLLDFFFR